MKKFLCFILCVILACPQFVVPVYSADEGEVQEAVPVSTDEISKEKVKIRGILVSGSGSYIEGTNGYEKEYWEDGEYIGSYYHYDPSLVINEIYVQYSDGKTDYLTWEQAVGAEIFDGQSYYNQWSAGNSYKVTVEYKGFKDTFSVRISENRIASISVYGAKSFNEHMGGHWVSYEKEDGTIGEYYHYDVEKAIDGLDFVYTTGEKGGKSIQDLYDERYEYTQGPDNVWTVGNSYPVTVHFAGKSCVYYVEIKSNYIDHLNIVRMDPLYENAHGDWVSEYNKNGELVEYFKYDWSAAVPCFVVHYDMNSTKINYFRNLPESDYRVICDQSADNQWTVGNKYPATLWYGGKTYEFFIEVAENPVESITVPEYVEVMERTCGNVEYWFDNEGKYYDQYVYDVKQIIKEYTVNYKDGTSRTIDSDVVDAAVMICDQETQWVAGKKYSVYTEYMGVRAETIVEIGETDIAYYEVSKSVPLVYSHHSTSNWGYDENGEYFRYEEFDPTMAIQELTVHYKDGTSETFKRGMETIPDYCFHNQSSLNLWLPGNAYIAIAEYNGFEVEFQVNIVEQKLFDISYDENGLCIDYFADDESASAENIVIPSELYGEPVVTVNQLGRSNVKVNSITVSDSVKYIRTNAFEYLSEGDKVTVNLGAGIKDLNPLALSGLDNLAEINVSENNPYYTSVDGVLYDKNVTKLIAYPIAKGNKYTVPITVVNLDNKKYYPKVKFKIATLEDMYDIENGVYYNKGKTALLFAEPTVSGKVVIPDTVTEISEGAFRNCVGLESVVVSSKVTEISYAAFDGCTNLKSVTLPSSVKSIERFAFNNCASLGSITLAEGLEYIGEKAFLDSGVKRLSLPDSVESIGEYAFAYSDLEVFTAGSGLKTIGVGAFNECIDLQYASLNEGLESIGYDAFRACVSLEQIVIPDSVTNIGMSAFRESGIKYLTIGSGLIRLPEECFMGCSSLEGVMIPENVTSFGYGVFADCVNLKNVDIRGDVESFGTSMFKGCDALDIIPQYKGQSVITAGEFYDCDSIYGIHLFECTEKIEINAFYGCDNMELIIYEGTKEQWNNIVIEEGNEILNECVIVYEFSVDYYKYVVVTVNGQPHVLGRSSEFMMTADKVEYSILDGKAYVFDGWLVNDDIEYTVDGCSILTNSLFEDVSIDYSTYVHGNVNEDEDGKVTAADMLALLDGIKNSAESEAYDVNLDGKITAADKLALMQVIKGTFDYSQF